MVNNCESRSIAALTKAFRMNSRIESSVKIEVLCYCAGVDFPVESLRLRPCGWVF